MEHKIRIYEEMVEEDANMENIINDSWVAETLKNEQIPFETAFETRAGEFDDFEKYFSIYIDENDVHRVKEIIDPEFLLIRLPGVNSKSHDENNEEFFENFEIENDFNYADESYSIISEEELLENIRKVLKRRKIAAKIEKFCVILLCILLFPLSVGLLNMSSAEPVLVLTTLVNFIVVLILVFIIVALNNVDLLDEKNVKSHIYIPILRNQLKNCKYQKSGITEEEFEQNEISRRIKYNILKSENKIILESENNKILFADLKLSHKTIFDKYPTTVLEGTYIKFKTDKFFADKIFIEEIDDCINEEDEYLYEDSDDENIFKNLNNYSEDEMHKKIELLMTLVINGNEEAIRNLDSEFIFKFLELYNKYPVDLYFFAEGNLVTILMQNFRLFNPYEVVINDKLSESENLENINKVFEKNIRVIMQYIELFDRLKLSEY